MKNNRIQQLVQKYLEGNTTLEEERILAQFFSDAGEVDDDLRPLKLQFELFNKGRELSFDAVSLESAILGRIEDFEKLQVPAVKRFNISRLLVAASIALLITVSGVLVFRAQNRLKDTYSDPRLAYYETQKTLLYISQKMNKGIQPLSNISKINSSTRHLKKLEKIDESMGMLNLVSFINHSSNLKK
jgi:hypothetical protein